MRLAYMSTLDWSKQLPTDTGHHSTSPVNGSAKPENLLSESRRVTNIKRTMRNKLIRSFDEAVEFRAFRHM